MPGSSNSIQQTRFFGLHIGSLWRDLLTAWHDMFEWRILSWLWPKSAVRLWLPTGNQAFSRDLNTPTLHDEQRARSARFEAILLPEDLLLRRTLNLPRLQPDELQAALALEAQTLNPFPAGDGTWTHEIGSSNDSTIRIHLALTSRKLIALHIKSKHPELEAKTPEIWISRTDESGFLMLLGFGDPRRQQQSTVWRWVSALLAILALTLIVALAVTPSAQLYLRAMQAKQAMLVLQKKSIPVIAQRESLIHSSEKLTHVAELTGKPVPPLQILKLITEVLSDDTSLISLQIQDLKVSITGQTINAATLMKQLDNTPGLRDVKAPIPAIKPLGAPRESFTIEFTIDPAQLKPAA